MGVWWLLLLLLLLNWSSPPMSDELGSDSMKLFVTGCFAETSVVGLFSGVLL